MILIRLILIDFFLKTTLQEIPLLMSLSRQGLETVLVSLKLGTVSSAERCDLVGMKLEKVHELFQVFRICVAKLNGSFYYKRQSKAPVTRYRIRIGAT